MTKWTKQTKIISIFRNHSTILIPFKQKKTVHHLSTWWSLAKLGFLLGISFSFYLQINRTINHRLLRQGHISLWTPQVLQEFKTLVTRLVRPSLAIGLTGTQCLGLLQCSGCGWPCLYRAVESLDHGAGVVRLEQRVHLQVLFGTPVDGREWHSNNNGPLEHTQHTAMYFSRQRFSAHNPDTSRETDPEIGPFPVRSVTCWSSSESSLRMFRAAWEGGQRQGHSHEQQKTAFPLKSGQFHVKTNHDRPCS